MFYINREMKLVTEYSFYCDKCHQHIARKVIENRDDLKQDSLGYTTMLIEFNGKKYFYEYYFCKECKDDFIENMENALKESTPTSTE